MKHIEREIWAPLSRPINEAWKQYEKRVEVLLRIHVEGIVWPHQIRRVDFLIRGEWRTK